MLQFQLIVYAIIKITRRGTTVPLYELAAKQPKKEHKLGVKDFCKNEVRVGMNLKKVQKQGRDESTTTLSCCRKVVVFFTTPF